MRITNRMMLNNNIDNLTSSMNRLYDLRKQAATHKKYLNASDNPSNNASVLTLKSALQTSEIFETTAQNTNDWMEATDFALQQAGGLNQRAISAVMRGLSDTMGDEARATIAEEVDGMIKEAMDIANTKHLDRYIFSGFTTDQKPFEPQYLDATNTTKVTDVYYKNNSPAAIAAQPTLAAFQAIRRDIGPGETITVNVDGYTTFNDFIQTLIDLRDNLTALPYDSAAQQALRDTADDLNTALNKLTLATTINGSRMRDLEGAQDRIAQSNTEIKSLLSQKEEANMAEVTAELANQENIYQMVVTISSRTQSMVNLFESLG